MSQNAYTKAQPDPQVDDKVLDLANYTDAQKWYKKLRSLCIDKHSPDYPHEAPAFLLKWSLLMRWGSPAGQEESNEYSVLSLVEDEELARKTPKDVQIAMWCTNYDGTFIQAGTNKHSHVIQASQKAQSLGTNKEGKDCVPLPLLLLLQAFHDKVQSLSGFLPAIMFRDLRVNDVVLYRTFKKFFQDNNIDIDVIGDNCKSERKEKVLSPTYVFCAECYVLDPQNKCCAKCKIAYYCSTECQKKDWPQHKEECEKLQKDQSDWNAWLLRFPGKK